MAYQRAGYGGGRRRRPGAFVPPPDEAEGGDVGVLGQMLAQLRQLSEAVSHAATKEDVAKLVQRDLYDSQRAADQTRLLGLEQSISALREGQHKLELGEATRFAQFQSQTAAQVGQVAQGAAQQAAATQLFSAANINKVLFAIVTLLGGLIAGIVSGGHLR